MRHLTKLRRLKHVGVQRTHIGDEGVRELGKFDHPLTVWVKGSKVTPEGIASMKTLAPTLTVIP